MSVEVWIVMFVASAALGAQLWLRPFPSLLARRLFIVSICAVFGILFYSSYVQYATWAEGGTARYLLPPYQGWDYFLFYVGSRLWAPWITAFLASLVVPRAARAMNRRYGERFFYEEEFGLMRLGTFLTGWPGFLLYIPLVLFLGVVLSALYGFLGKGRAPLLYVWMPCAISVILIVQFVIPRDVVVFFNF